MIGYVFCFLENEIDNDKGLWFMIVVTTKRENPSFFACQDRNIGLYATNN